MPSPTDWQLHLRNAIRAACMLEATARKPGNVHPEAAFEDVRYEDFVRSADVTAPVLAETRQLGVGRAIREAVSVTQRVVGGNTNLGIILLLAPLAVIPEEVALNEGIRQVLDQLTVEDAQLCFEAIRMARPGGLGDVDDQDVHVNPTVILREAMQMAADRDRIAEQYANGFREVLDVGVPFLVEQPWETDWERSVIRLHLQLMADYPDTLIARKCGADVADESAQRAKRVIDCDWPETETGRQEIQRFDRWLRADGHRRNPGTTADLVAAILFAALRDRRIPLPPLK